MYPKLSCLAVLYSKPRCNYLHTENDSLRASPALGKVAMIQTGWEKDGDSLSGEAYGLQAVSALVLSTVPHIPDAQGRWNRGLGEEQ